MADPIDWPPRRPSSRRRGMLVVLALVVVLFLSASTTLSYYVDALWFSVIENTEIFFGETGDRTIFRSNDNVDLN